MVTVLSRRALNRATLARQLLLHRAAGPVEEAVEHLVGLQAQTPHSWYVGLWSRIAGLDANGVAGLLTNRRLVRIGLMRSTIHLVTAADALALRPVLQPVLDRDLFSNHTHGRAIRAVDLPAVIAAGRAALEERPRTPKDLGALLRAQWPDTPAATLAYAIRNQVPLVQVPPRGLWRRSGPIAHTTADAWLGATEQTEPARPEHLVRRYLTAFGPATVKDIQTWSGLRRLGDVTDRVRTELVTFRDDLGHVEFLDVIGSLSDPGAHGGDPADAFHVIVPTIPGFGIPGPVVGWDTGRVAEAWAILMARLGYDRYAAQGGDYGSVISRKLGIIDAEHVVALHLTALYCPQQRARRPMTIRTSPLRARRRTATGAS